MEKSELFQTEDGQNKVQTRLEDETVWLTQTQMAEFLGKRRSTITEHINNLFKEGELEKDDSQNLPITTI